MSETLPIGIAHVGSNPGVELSSPSSTSSSTSSSSSSIEFRALLERLREQAASLERATAGSIRAEELSGAVQNAGESLQGALSIAEGLLEAYRSSRVEAAGVSAARSLE